jgi:hypothetical protein
MENSPQFPQFLTLTRQISEQFETREQQFRQEYLENARHLATAGELLRRNSAPGIAVAVPRTLNNPIRFLLHRQDWLSQEIRRVRRFKRLFFPSSDPLSAPSYTHLTIYNYRAEFLQQIEDLQQRVDEYKASVDSALEILSTTLPPSSPEYFLRVITEDEYHERGKNSPSLDSSSTTSSHHPSE